jgi:hypothetical protein
MIDFLSNFIIIFLQILKIFILINIVLNQHYFIFSFLTYFVAQRCLTAAPMGHVLVPGTDTASGMLEQLGCVSCHRGRSWRLVIRW